MYNKIFLNQYFDSHERVILELIESIYNDVKEYHTRKRNRYLNPHLEFTLQQNYIQQVVVMSPSKIVKAIKKLIEDGVISMVSEKRGECTLYRYHPEVVQEMISDGRKEKRQLITGRKVIKSTGKKKTPTDHTASEIYRFMVGKSIDKVELLTKREYAKKAENRRPAGDNSD